MLTESGLAQKAEIEKLVSTDAAVAAVMDFDNAELHRLVEKHAKDRADLEDAMQAKQRSSSAALKMRLAEKRARKKQQLKADGASAEDTAAAMVQLDHEDVEALDQLEARLERERGDGLLGRGRLHDLLDVVVSFHDGVGAPELLEAVQQGFRVRGVDDMLDVGGAAGRRRGGA